MNSETGGEISFAVFVMMIPAAEAEFDSENRKAEPPPESPSRS